MCEVNQETIPIREAVGTILCQDITEVNEKSGYKGPHFRRGHHITQEDIPKFLELGKENLYVLRIEENRLHENDAVRLLAKAVAGQNTSFFPEPSEGKINIIAGVTGLLKVQTEALERFNAVNAVMCATRHTNSLVDVGDIIAGTRTIPLVVDKELIDEAAAIASGAGGLVSILPLKKARVGLVITGNEIYTGRIKDAFEPIIRGKVESLGSSVVSVIKCPDNILAIRLALAAVRKEEVDMIVMTGGMSVDPDDVTLLGAQEAGVNIAAYGSSVLPGSMFMVGYFPHGAPVLGVPACGIHHPRTIFDLILPRVLAGEKINNSDIAKLGHGGLCLDCPECRYPVCPFGK